jgi:hypothetical protein
VADYSAPGVNTTRRVVYRHPIVVALSLCILWSPILNDHSGVVANCDNMSEWVDWVRGCIGITMCRVTLRISLLAFLLPARKMQFFLY